MKSTEAQRQEPTNIGTICRKTEDLDQPLPGYVVQDLFFPKDKSVSELYLRILYGYVEFGENLILSKGAKISSNTFFNSFYESYWNKFTSLDELQLVLQFKGRLRIDIFRDTGNSGCHKIEWKYVESTGDDATSIKLPRLELGQSGRIFFDIVAKEESRIYYMGLRTNNPPLRVPKLTIGICTFNREEYLLKNLGKLVQYTDHEKIISKIIVVSQGDDFRNPRLKQLIAENDHIQCIDQENLGGCGGFTRTMYESMRVEEANYHVLMDDDVQIDTRIITNLAAFISHLTKEVVVGGHMLDLLRPLILYEAGAIIQENTRIKPQHHNIDLRVPDSLLPFNSVQAVDYNAWWFCAVPKKYLREASYPAPIFIRGDDMEYGVRLQQMGVETVSMPGIAVWHEPFYVKAGGWQTYYDSRNRLILASVYPERFRLESPLYMLWIMMKALSVHDYQSASLVQMAIEDFMKGPALFDQESSMQIHDRVSTLSKKYQPKPSNAGGEYRTLKLKKNPATNLGRSLLIARRLMMIYLTGNSGKDGHIFLDKDVQPANIGAHAYIKTNGIGNVKLLYAPNRKLLLFLIKACFSAYLRYRNSSGGVAQKWHQEIQRFRDEKWWEKTFPLK